MPAVVRTKSGTGLSYSAYCWRLSLRLLLEVRYSTLAIAHAAYMGLNPDTVHAYLDFFVNITKDRSYGSPYGSSNMVYFLLRYPCRAVSMMSRWILHIQGIILGAVLILALVQIGAAETIQVKASDAPSSEINSSQIGILEAFHRANHHLAAPVHRRRMFQGEKFHIELQFNIYYSFPKIIIMKYIFNLLLLQNLSSIIHIWAL